MPCFCGHQQLKRYLFFWNDFLPLDAGENVIPRTDFTVSFDEDQLTILDFQSAP